MSPSLKIDPEAEFAFVSGQGRATWPSLIADFIARSETVAERDGVILDLRYGDGPRRTYDFVPGRGAVRGCVIYLHPGYWQMRDKAQFRCIADTFAPMGFDTCVANYPLAPEAGVAEITDAVRDLVVAVCGHMRSRYGRDLPIVASGHSAGAHLAVELALTDAGHWALSKSPIAGLVALSGVYDLLPLVSTSLNTKLGLTQESAHAVSPIHRVGGVACPALFAVGGGETSAFREQNAAMARGWRTAGGDVEVREEGDEDHFSLIARLIDPTSELNAALRSFSARF